MAIPGLSSVPGKRDLEDMGGLRALCYLQWGTVGPTCRQEKTDQFCQEPSTGLDRFLLQE